jgi:Na+/melibiose symporter-like transporter
VGDALPLLGVGGYQPNIEQPPAVLMTLRVLYFLGPCACNLAAIVVALAYPIDRRRHEEIRAAIEPRSHPCWGRRRQR